MFFTCVISIYIVYENAHLFGQFSKWREDLVLEKAETPLCRTQTSSRVFFTIKGGPELGEPATFSVPSSTPDLALVSGPGETPGSDIQLSTSPMRSIWAFNSSLMPSTSAANDSTAA